MTATNHYKKDEGLEKLRRSITQQALFSYKNILGPKKMRCIFFKWSPTSMAPNFLHHPWKKNGQKNGFLSLHKEYMLIIKSIFLGRMLEPISRKQTLRHILLLFGNNLSEKLHRRAVGFSLESKILQKKIAGCKKSSCAVHGRRQCMRSHGWLASVQTCMCDHI